MEEILPEGDVRPFPGLTRSSAERAGCQVLTATLGDGPLDRSSTRTKPEAAP